MLKEDLVSVIVPCYNAEDFLDRFIESLLIQTNHYAQIIIVNDGSTDMTDSIINKWTSLLDEKFYEFIYLQKENGGAGSAVNLALNYVTGEYLMWADCDDVLHKNNIEYKKNYLKSNPRKGLVLCSAQKIDNCTNEMLEVLSLDDSEKTEYLFNQILFKNLPCFPGVFMIRTILLLRRLDENRTIFFTPEVGQNYQLLLPVAIDQECGFIDDILYFYYVRNDSHSRNTNHLRELKRTFLIEDVVRNTLSFLPNDELDVIMQQFTLKMEYRRIYLSYICRIKNQFCKSYMVLKKEKKIGIKLRIKKIIICLIGSEVKV